MPNTRPGILFQDSICYPCLSFENRKNIDMIKRLEELEELCNKHRQNNGQYDCVITVSGGKDSHYQVWLFKEIMKLNPLGIMVDNFSWTKTGRANFNNLSERFGIDIITFTPNRKTMKERIHSDFLEYLHPSKYWDEILYEKPVELAYKLGIGLVIWGENTSLELGGFNYKETPNANCLMKKPIFDIDNIFTSYYVPWKSLIERYKIAKKLGFQGLEDTHEWDNRLGYQTFHYAQVDTIGYLVNEWCKFIKFGFSAMTEHCSNMVRHGKMTRKKAVKMINDFDWQLDLLMLDNFCNGINITKELFWQTIDKFANREILEKRNGIWRLKEGVR